MRRLLLAVFLLAFFGFGVAVSYYNIAPVTFDYLAGRVDVPLIGLLLASFVLGALVAGVLNLATNLGIRMERNRLQRQLGAAEVELRSLRQLSAPDPSAKGGPKNPNA